MKEDPAEYAGFFFCRNIFLCGMSFFDKNCKISFLYCVALTGYSKGGLDMKRIEKKVMVQMLLGFLIGRVVLMERNPVGAAYFVAGFMQGGNIWATVISLCLGMASSLRLEMTMRYGAAMLAVAIAKDLLEQNDMKIKLWQSSAVMAVTLAVLSVVQYCILPFQWKDIFFAAMEVILVLALSRVLYEGQFFLEHYRRGKTASHEELLSILLMGLLALYGVPEVMISGISLTELAVLFLVPALSYQYGAGLGAVAGATGGMLLALTGQDSNMIGSLCLIGICVGGIRRQGKIWSFSAYLLSAFCIGVTLNDMLLDPGMIKTLLLDSIILVLLPEKLFRRLRFPLGHPEESEEAYAQKLMRHKLQDFSNSFQKLSRVLEKQSQEKNTLSRHDIRVLMREMSEQVCDKCSNREYCMGQVAVNRPENISMLAMAQEQGQLALEQMPAEFAGECIHPEWFLMETNQSLRMARTIMSFQNKLAQNRRVLAGQMEQVGVLLEALAEDMGQLREIPMELEAVICKEFGNMRVKVRNLVIYEDKDGHLEVHMLAATNRGRLVTAREAASVLTDLIGKPFMPSRESHNVIPKQEVQMIFVEDTPFYAVTGVARMAKAGEEVSGDTFSCLSLPNGELLLALSDGMGSGEEALEESQVVIELLEQMTEAGFSKVSALKLINSLYMPESEETSFATADVVVLNLYQGICQFIKNGAAATWLRRGDVVERIEGQALPVGVLQEADPYLNKTEIYSGDYVIMMTDGIVDAFEGREQELEELLWQENIVNPQELAEHILEEAVARCGGYAKDDMSVVAAGVWERSCAAEAHTQEYRTTGKRKRGYHEATILSQGQEVL